MKKNLALITIALAVLLSALACGGGTYTSQTVFTTTARFPAGITAEARIFYDDLAGLGSWVRLDGPGWVWYPRSVQAGWRPYTFGRWAYTDYGWTWDSEEEWGWAVYHYGRWHHTPQYGWVWVPGAEWGPAWVSWHSGGGWVGWAPLPWQVSWRAGVGLDWGRIDTRVDINPAWWCFVPTRHLTDPSPRQHFASATRNLTLIKVTKNITNYTFVDNRVVNEGVSVNVISKAIGRAVPRIAVRPADTPRGTLENRLNRNELKIFRPGLRRGQQPDGTPGHAKQSDREEAANSDDQGRETEANEKDRSAQPVDSKRPSRLQSFRDRAREQSLRKRSPWGRPDDQPVNRPDDRQDDRPSDRPEDRPEDRSPVRPDDQPGNRPDDRQSNRPDDQPGNRPDDQPRERPGQGRGPEGGGPPATVPDDDDNRGHGQDQGTRGNAQDQGTRGNGQDQGARGSGQGQDPQSGVGQPPRDERGNRPQGPSQEANRPKPGNPRNDKAGKEGKQSPKPKDSDKKQDAESEEKPEEGGSQP